MVADKERFRATAFLPRDKADGAATVIVGFLARPERRRGRSIAGRSKGPVSRARLIFQDLAKRNPDYDETLL
jgi:hypothetical protein